MIFISETQPNVIEAVTNIVAVKDPIVYRNLEIIASKKHNNYVGYYQFKHNDEFFKILVVPKIFESEPNEIKEARTFEMLSKYYEVRRTYQLKSKHSKMIEGNVMDVGFYRNRELSGALLQDIIEEKYLIALDNLDQFFKKHNKQRKRTQKFDSNTISANLNLLKNVTSLDKSRVHQIKKIEYKYSKVAEITKHCIKHFKNNRIKHISNPNLKSEIARRTLKLEGRINKKYGKTLMHSFNVLDLVSNKTIQLFRKSVELRKVHESLLILSGLEQFLSNDQNLDSRKIENMNSIFFRPEKLYEWIVYGQLNELFPDADIHKDELDKGTSKPFYLIENGLRIKEYTSNPDYVIHDGSQIYIIDAKWKVIKENMYPDEGDVSKLKRDTTIRTGENTISWLIYPTINNVSIKDKALYFNIDLDFKFEIKEFKAI